LKPNILAIILNWNKPQDTLRCLEMLGEDIPRLVVDNGSAPESREILRKAIRGVPMIELPQNLGYAGGNNVGIRWALENHFDWILLINEDAILTGSDLLHLISIAETDPLAGFAGPLILHADSDHLIQSAGGQLNRFWHPSHRGQNQVNQGQYVHPEEVDWLSGCALLARSQMIRSIGYLDESFFLYEEELDWCIRARQAGWKCLFVPEIQARHAGVRPDYEPPPYITYYMVRNHFRLLAKHRAGFLPWAYALIQSLRTLIVWSVRPKWRSKRLHRDALWLAMKDFLQGKSGPLSQNI